MGHVAGAAADPALADRHHHPEPRRLFENSRWAMTSPPRWRAGRKAMAAGRAIICFCRRRVSGPPSCLCCPELCWPLRAAPSRRSAFCWPGPRAGGWSVELVPTKLPHYVIDAYPPLAILAAMFVLDPRPVRFLAPARWIAIAQFVIGAASAVVAVIILAPLYFGSGLLPAQDGRGRCWPRPVWRRSALTALVLAILKKFPAGGASGLSGPAGVRRPA